VSKYKHDTVQQDKTKLNWFLCCKGADIQLSSQHYTTSSTHSNKLQYTLFTCYM